jgi:hypothetical protein
MPMRTERISLKSIQVLEYKTFDKTVYGCDQNIYKQKWQRMSGCGPAAASTALIYMNTTRNLGLPYLPGSENAVQQTMEDVWQYVTPSLTGINNIEKYVNGIKNLAEHYDILLECKTLNISRLKSNRPTHQTVYDFIKKGLLLDSPVAFLNLHPGSVSNLEGYHWTVIVEMLSEEGSDLSVIIYEQGKSRKISLTLWLETTKRGGGFVFIQ